MGEQKSFQSAESYVSGFLGCVHVVGLKQVRMYYGSETDVTRARHAGYSGQPANAAATESGRRT